MPGWACQTAFHAWRFCKNGRTGPAALASQSSAPAVVGGAPFMVDLTLLPIGDWI
jgi:hypothetical protein